MALSKYKGVVKVDATSSTTVLTDYSSDIIDFSLPFTKNVGSHFTIANAWRQSTEGGMQFDLKMTVRYSNSASSAYQVFLAWAIAGGARTIECYTPDTSTGSGKISGEWICAGPDNGMDISGGSGDVHSVVFTFQSDSTITPAVV